jgi:hypothetical protein
VAETESDPARICDVDSIGASGVLHEQGLAVSSGDVPLESRAVGSAAYPGTQGI